MQILTTFIKCFATAIFFAALPQALGQSAASQESPSSKELVHLFLSEVRSGKFPERARLYMAGTVIAHQVQSEAPVSIERTPEDYANHVREFIRLFGQFEFQITELLADGPKVYARWVQDGCHLQEMDGHKPTGAPLVEYTSAVYRVENGKIAEYWLQTDRKGFETQLQRGH
ncbi:ester cyclase [Dyadobacter sp. CY261]|uniref:ester cyclase n=1 Tax=Dyadobacter sp. CY261 TaxID=2907203 RepID=UPI001F2407EA|nr:ester cyclase [Dyadobacter sp. CY261]MCF0075715.1 ester cyclase [Dyadobacter sp. CY261]